MERRRKMLFSAFTILSLIALAVLPIGYAGTFGVVLTRQQPPGAFRQIDLTLDRGRVAVWSQSATASALPPGVASTLPGGSHVRWIGRLQAPSGRDWQRALWEFDVHALSNVSMGSAVAPGASVFLLAFPIWCVAIPCMILPSIWWVRRRRKMRARHVEGFAVIEPGNGANAATRPA